MQFKLKPTPAIPSLGDQRVRQFFAVLPFKCGGTIYFMERVEVCEQFRKVSWLCKGKWLIKDVVTNHPKIEAIRGLYPSKGRSYGCCLGYIEAL